MPASISDIAPSGEPAAAPDWVAVDAVLRCLQQSGAAEVDKGLKQLLQALLAMTHARHVSCTLVDIRPGHRPTMMFTESAGLWSVEGALHSATGSVKCEFEIRPGRHLVLDVAPTRPEHAVPVDAVVQCLSTLQRWLIWLDLSHGPVTDQGLMPRHHRRVLLALLKGMSEKQIAADLDLSIHTTHQYVTALYRRFNVRNRGSLMAIWLNPL